MSVIIGLQRFELESDFKNVEMAMSLNKVRELVPRKGYDENKLLSQLKENGVSSIVINEDTIEMLSLQGKISYLDTNDLTKYNWIHESAFFEFESILPGEILLICRDPALFERLKNFFQLYIGSNQVQEYFLDGDNYYLKIQGDQEELLKLGLGFSKEYIQKIKSLGFDVILRPQNSPKITPEIINYKLSMISKIENPSMVIFDEEEALGYPSTKMLSKTAQFLKDNHLPFGVIEFTSQKGIDTISSKASELAVRVHSITKGEMESITTDKAIDRWTRAAQERNIRLFYLNPFLSSREGDLIQQNLTYLKSIKDRLSNNDYKIGTASLFPTYQIPLFYIFIIGLGIISAGILLLMEFFNLENKYYYFMFTIGLIFLPFIYFIVGKIFLMKILALSGALVFPVLAIIKNKNYLFQEAFQENISNRFSVTRSSSYIQLVKEIIFGISRIMFIALIGGLLIGALLTHYQFILAIQLFSGIKVAYIFPLILVILYLWWISKENKMLLIDDFKKPILFEHAFLVFIFLIFMVIYILRSGNFSFLPVLNIEEKMRVFLESFLVARPRSKEFLIGYPLLSVVIAMNYLHVRFLKYPILVMGTVAPVTLINTFCHVHTSIYFSLLRTFHGYWLGLLFGILLASIFYLLNKNFRAWLNVKRS
ncbi:MAG: DUF5693 family protein [Atribacterota bacterium]